MAVWSASRGGGPSTVERVAAARAHDEAAPKAETPDPGIEVAGLRRVHGALLTVIADVDACTEAGPKPPALQPADIEIICGKIA